MHSRTRFDRRIGVKGGHDPSTAVAVPPLFDRNADYGPSIYIKREHSTITELLLSSAG